MNYSDTAAVPLSPTILGILIIIAIVAMIYFVPTIIATRKNHPQKTACILLNIFLGWTFIGWVVALVWSVMNYDNTKNNN